MFVWLLRARESLLSWRIPSRNLTEFHRAFLPASPSLYSSDFTSKITVPYWP